MRAEKERKPWSGSAITVAVLLIVLLLPAYLASLGPARWFLRRGFISYPTYRTYIEPARVALKPCPPAFEAVGNYVNLFDK